MTTIVSNPPPLRICSPSEVNARPARVSLPNRKRSKKAGRRILAAEAPPPSFTPGVAKYIPELKFRFRKHETNKLPEPAEKINSVITGAVWDLLSPIARGIDIKLAVLHTLLEQNGIFPHVTTNLFFPWKELRLTFHTDGIYGAKRAAVLLDLNRIRKYGNVNSYVVASSISCAQNIRRSLPSERVQNPCKRGGIIPVHVLGYDHDRIYLYSVHISTMLLDGLKSPSIALRNHSADVHFWEAGFQSGKELRLLLCSFINALKTEWHLSTTLEQSYQSTT